MHEEGQSHTVAARAATGALTVYKRWISPFLPPACRFTPTCSEYMREAVDVYGLGRGLWLGVRRLCRCHPWNPGGHDPVPPREEGS